MEMKQIMVAGAGQMGSGIAQTAAGAGFLCADVRCAPGGCGGRIEAVEETADP